MVRTQRTSQMHPKSKYILLVLDGQLNVPLGQYISSQFAEELSIVDGISAFFFFCPL